MTRSQLRKIFERNRGASSKLATDICLHKTTISAWFSGRLQSERVHSAVRTRALELLDKERAALLNSGGEDSTLAKAEQQVAEPAV